MTLPLEGTVVLDLTRLLPGNYATLLLADLGADVIKVEEPRSGDYIRWIPPIVDGQSAIHRALNRNKRSVTLNLKSEEGAATLRRLAARADALVESFRPGVLDRLGVGYAAVSSENPGLVYCAITGYGQGGPYRNLAGHDINYMGYAGALHATGSPGGPPVVPAVQVGDLGGAMAASLGTVAALAEARATGRGRFVDVSMYDVVVSWLGVAMSAYLATGEVPARGGGRLTGGLACYRVYRAADGYLAVGALEPQFWGALCRALGVPELTPDHYAPPERQEEVAARLQEIFATKTREEWVGDLAGLETCVGPVYDVSEAMRDAQFRHRGLLASVGGVPLGPGPAIKLAGESPPTPTLAPALGEHTDDVLGELGLSGDEISRFRSRGIV